MYCTKESGWSLEVKPTIFYVHGYQSPHLAASCHFQCSCPSVFTTAFVSGPPPFSFPWRPSALLVRILRVVPFAHPNLSLLFGGDVLDPGLLGVLLLEVTDVPWVPQLGRDAQILAAAHERVTLASFAGGGDAVVVAKELTLAAGLGYESVQSPITLESEDRSCLSISLFLGGGGSAGRKEIGGGAV